MTAAIVIPARFGSTRFPGKPLARQTGKFLIQHVVEQAQKARKAELVIVATDDARIADAVQSFGGQAVMTSPTHPSGTDRIAEVIRRPEFAAVQVVVNVQGDEPEIDPALIDDLIHAVTAYSPGLARDSAADLSAPAMATAAASLERQADILNPNIVKVVTDQRGFALYFSRAAIPYQRDGGGGASGNPAGLNIYRKHLGIYAYRREALLTLSAAPACELEQIEKLEQLRALHLGLKIFVQQATHAPHGIDTPEDYAAFVQRYNHSNPPPLAANHGGNHHA